MRKLIRVDGTTMDLPAGLHINDRFGRWLVVGAAPDHVQRCGTHLRAVTVRCDCSTTRAVRVQLLRDGQSKSCGCLHKEIQAVRLKAYATTHGLTRTGAWNSWMAMKTRCENEWNKAFKYYGGRGIQVCERWKSFENFYADMGDRPKGLTIDRIDVDGNYEPGNCRWATQQEQCRNKRTSRPICGDVVILPDGDFA